ncbi:hypothetical protein Cgig2_030175 [Carnegiea gigantea]|uniref:GDSL esterase/lipase n=1 Tax=Carnegiea gigantea TaxID=171969 RepID=A0A9Q1KAA5_9CARY|nr:hypothetical protein Cgig2_030175 [Carnegiea gigantea]
MAGQSLNTSLLSAYLEALGSDFRNGANFAVSGSTTRPRNVRFALNVQIMQFLHFKARSLQLAAATTGSKGLINEEGFRNALYMIDIGQNDLAYPFTQNQSYSQVVPRIPLVIAEIKHALKTLYDEGGRKFWIHNTGPLGCLPELLWLAQPDKEDLDTSGCISSQNSVAKLFNEALLQLCQDIKSEMVDATIVYVDIYSIKPLMACCGAGGPPYNFDQTMICGDPRSQACTDGSRYISWDGIHYTEAANAIVAKRILSTHYSIPRISFNFLFQNHHIIEKDTDSMSVSEI